MKESSWWQMGIAISTVTLAERQRRRRLITSLLGFILAYFAVGNWLIDSWLEDGLWRMLIFWGGLFLVLLFVMLLAIYDALAVIGEEREKIKEARASVEAQDEGD